jgi:hypothetical protein
LALHASGQFTSEQDEVFSHEIMQQPAFLQPKQLVPPVPPLLQQVKPVASDGGCERRSEGAANTIPAKKALIGVFMDIPKDCNSMPRPFTFVKHLVRITF